MDGAVRKRLHIGGLTPNFSAEALREKLAQYGEVQELEGCTDDYVDAVGNRRPYAFATLYATPAQLAKCMNALSGAIWKGAKLRVGEAKPPITERITQRSTKEAKAAEGAQERAAERQKRRLRKRPWIGLEHEDMRPLTPESIGQNTWGWKKTPAGHLVRPMHMRPERPLARPPDLPPGRNKAPPARTPRITIDPTRYAREHLSGPMLDALGDAPHGHLRWVCEEEDAHPRLWRALDAQGTTVSTEPVPSRHKQRPPTHAAHMKSEHAATDALAPDAAHAAANDGFDALSEDGAAPTDVPTSLFDAAPTSHGSWWEEGAQDPAPEPPSVSVPPSDVDTLMAHDDSAAPDALFVHAAPSSSAWWDEPAPEHTAERSQPVFESKRAPAPVLDDSDFSDGYEEMPAAAPASVSDERSRQLALLGGLLHNVPDASDAASLPAVHPQPAASDDDARPTEAAHDASEAPAPTLPSDDTLVPAAAAATEPASAAHDAAVPPPASSASPPSEPPAGANDTPQPTSLKDMFQHDGTFTLFGGMGDEDWDDAVFDDARDTPETPAPAPAPAPPTQSARFPLIATSSSLGHNSLLEALQRTGSQPFWCVDSDEQIEEHWKATRGDLTQSFKRLHREAVKKVRRRVAGSRAGTGTMRRGAPAARS